MALDIATSDVIAEVNFTALDSTTNKHDYWGYVAELIYRFEVVQYLKGDGAETLDVHIGSGPKYIMFPDVLGQRSESEAREIERNWLSLSRADVGNKRVAILLLHRSPQTGEHSFLRFDERAFDYPAFGETWLNEVEDSMYHHQFTDGEPATIAFADLKDRIADMQRLTDGAYGQCVSGALHWRNRVRSQLLGTYQELTLGGFREPDPFPRFEVSLDSYDSRYYPLFESSRPVFEFRRPPYRLPVFSDYWLDGEDRNLFEIHTTIDPDYTYEAMTIVNDLQQGAYSVHYGQYHQSLPCDEESPRVEGDWRTFDTAEWVVNIN